MSTPLSENVWIRPKVSIFCVATIIFQHCLNPLGHGVHYSFTGCHWSHLPLLHDDITELVDVRDLALLHLRLRMPHRLPLPSTSLGRQWSSRRCVWGCYHVGILPCGPVLRREGIMLCVSMSQYILAFMVPQWTVAPQCWPAPHAAPTMTLPPHAWL